jgi:hypothetical protein
VGNGVAAAFPNGSSEADNKAVGRDELARGLMLVRASTMKVVRLQLAMERRDRRLALQTVDDLVDLDGKIRDFLKDIPSASGDAVPMQQEIEEQRGWLAREKHTLAAGIGKSGTLTLGREWIEPASAIATPAAEPLPRHVFPEIDEDRRSSPRVSFRFVLGIVLLLMIAALSASLFFGAGAWEELINRLSLLWGAS